MNTFLWTTFAGVDTFLWTTFVERGMYPIDFEEFCLANRVSDSIIEEVKSCFDEKKPVDPFIHGRLMSLFRLYIMVGGMPAVVGL